MNKEEEETSKLFTDQYFPKPSKEAKQFLNKQELLKQLSEIEEFENRHNPEKEAERKRKLRKAVELDMKEQQKRNVAVNTRFEQDDINWNANNSLGS